MGENARGTRLQTCRGQKQVLAGNNSNALAQSPSDDNNHMSSLAVFLLVGPVVWIIPCRVASQMQRRDARNGNVTYAP